MSSFLTQFFSHSSLRDLQERRRFCHITFRVWHEKGRLSDTDDQKTFPPVAWKCYVSKCAGSASQLSRCSEMLFVGCGKVFRQTILLADFYQILSGLRQ